MGKLRHLRRGQGLPELLVEIHRLENVGDENHAQATQLLFEGQPDAIALIKWKEVYERLERAIDSVEDVADLLEGVMLKNA